MKIIVADDDKTQRILLKSLLGSRLGAEILEASNGQECVELFLSSPDDIGAIIMDLSMPVMDGKEALQIIRQKSSYTPILILTASRELENAIETLKNGAFDFLVKPVNSELLLLSIRNALKINSLAEQVSLLQRSNDGRFRFTDIIGFDGGLSAISSSLRKAASSEIPILITGETGVGKEMIACALHGEGRRHGKKFVAVNCGAIPENLVESTLFGHEKGAFTGAIAKALGKFREADGGTIFLDEVGELPLEAQVKLLRTLQQRQVDPVGAAHPISVDVRIISATNRDLREEIKKGRFREDLYYRLNVMQISVPPLRERKEDIPHLARYFVRKYSNLENKSFRNVTEVSIKFLQSYSWPGNIRQLENVIHRSVVLSENDVIEIENLLDNNSAQDPIKENTLHHMRNIPPFSLPAFNLDGTLKTAEEMLLAHCQFSIQHCKGNMTLAAKNLKISKATLYRKINDGI